MKNTISIIIVIFISTYIICDQIEKHSVHPEHQRFQTVSMNCKPWDSCR